MYVTVRLTNTVQAMEHLDPIDLRWLRTSSPLLLGPRDQNQYYVGQDRQEAPQGW